MGKQFGLFYDFDLDEHEENKDKQIKQQLKESEEAAFIEYLKRKSEENLANLIAARDAFQTYYIKETEDTEATNHYIDVETKFFNNISEYIAKIATARTFEDLNLNFEKLQLVYQEYIKQLDPYERAEIYLEDNTLLQDYLDSVAEHLNKMLPAIDEVLATEEEDLEDKIAKYESELLITPSTAITESPDQEEIKILNNDFENILDFIAQSIEDAKPKIVPTILTGNSQNQMHLDGYNRADKSKNEIYDELYEGLYPEADPKDLAITFDALDDNSAAERMQEFLEEYTSKSETCTCFSDIENLKLIICFNQKIFEINLLDSELNLDTAEANLEIFRNQYNNNPEDFNNIDTNEDLIEIINQIEPNELDSVKKNLSL